MGKKKKHDLAVRRRAFAIWQKLGYYPWKKASKGRKKESGDFYKGAFDSIPFLNDDAKRTFSHLLLRPGYMIRDYIGGKHEKYLAPLTSLIVFYAFFALVAAVLQPLQHNEKEKNLSSFNVSGGDDGDETSQLILSTIRLVKRGYIFLNLDQYPEEVDTRHEAAIAALEGKLRSQGIPLFLGKFLLLWISMFLALRKYKLRLSAAAASSAYILCQFSFFMLFAVLLTFGENTSISLTLMLVLLSIDYHQWLNVRWGRSIRLAVRTGLIYLLLFTVIILLLSVVAVAIAMARS